MLTNHTKSIRTPHQYKIKHNSKYMLWVMIFVSFCLTNSMLGQNVDSLKIDKKQTVRSAWLNKPPSGKPEKTQGAIIMGLGASSILTGLIYMNQEDPCDDVSGEYVICT